MRWRRPGEFMLKSEIQETQFVADLPMAGTGWEESCMPQRRATALRWWVAFAASTLLVVFSHLLMKAGLIALAGHAPSASLQGRILAYLFQPWLVEGLALYALASLFWMLAVAQKDVSFLYPLTSVNYVLVVTGSLIIFHEVISPRRWMGVAFIVLGVVLLNRSEERGQ
jgi:uncharacterized membrane protein